MLPDREIHVVDSKNASMGVGILAILATELAAAGVPAEAIARTVENRADDVETVVVLDTLEYLRKGGRISGPAATFGTLLSVRPIIAIKDGAVDTIARVRTRSAARERAVEYLTPKPIERLAILHTISPDVDAFRAEILARAIGGIDPSHVSTEIVGPSVGPHLGPGAVGASILRKHGV
jgi:DegV family protein with EDD domain